MVGIISLFVHREQLLVDSPAPTNFLKAHMLWRKIVESSGVGL